MSGEEKLNEFIEAIDSWVTSKYVHNVSPEKDCPTALDFKRNDLRALTSEECAFHAYELYAYAEYVETLRTKENAVLEKKIKLLMLANLHIHQVPTYEMEQQIF